MKKADYIKGVEKLVNPIDVGTIHYMQNYTHMLPKFVQKKLINSSGVKTPYMGFVVEPYSTFLFYEIEDLELAKSYLPNDFELVKTKVFEHDTPKYYCVFGCVKAHTSAFWGARIEFYIMAKNTKTGLVTWIIVDYDTNTITYDPKYILNDPNVEKGAITIDYDGEIYVDFENKKDGRSIIFNVNVNDGKWVKPDKKMWIEGNLSIAYGTNRAPADDCGLFSLSFNPDEFNHALEIDVDKLNLEKNNWFEHNGLVKGKPAVVACFPYAQHFLSDSPGHRSYYKDEHELRKFIDTIDLDKLPVYSSKEFHSAMMLGTVVTTTIIAGLGYLLIKEKKKVKKLRNK